MPALRTALAKADFQSVRGAFKFGKNQHPVQDWYALKSEKGADGTPVLKNLVDRLLRQRGEVLAFHSAPTAQGGTGALLVLLARR